MTSSTARARASGVNVPTNWIRGPRLTAADIDARAGARMAYRQRGTPARRHKDRALIESARLLKGGRTITRLSVRP